MSLNSFTFFFSFSSFFFSCWFSFCVCISQFGGYKSEFELNSARRKNVWKIQCVWMIWKRSIFEWPICLCVAWRREHTLLLIFRHFLNSRNPSGQICLVYPVWYFFYTFLRIYMKNFNFFLRLKMRGKKCKISKLKHQTSDEDFIRFIKTHTYTNFSIIEHHFTKEYIILSQLIWMKIWIAFAELKKKNPNSKLKYTNCSPKSNQ